MDIKEEIFNLISTHESIVSNDIRNRDEDIDIRVTTFGNRAGCKALFDVIEMLDDDMKLKVLDMMSNKRVVSQPNTFLCENCDDKLVEEQGDWCSKCLGK